MVKTICIKKCFDNKLYTTGDTRTFETLEQAEDHPYFKVVDAPAPKKKKVKKTEVVENAE